jgi:hypothetical protein
MGMRRSISGCFGVLFGNSVVAAIAATVRIAWLMILRQQ